MNNADFRAMLSSPALAVPVKAGGKSAAGGGAVGGGTAAPSAAAKKADKRFFKPKVAKKSDQAGEGGEAEEGGGARWSTFRDRAAERRKELNAQHEQDEALVRATDYEKSKYLGGDLAHTHLVKGLDFALLAKVREEMQEQQDEALDAELQGHVSKSAAAAEAGDAATVDVDAAAVTPQPMSVGMVEHHTAAGAAIFAAAVAAERVLTASRTPSVAPALTPAYVVAALEGRQREGSRWMSGASVYDIVVDASLENEVVPILITRSIDDLPPEEPGVTDVLNEQLVQRLARALHPAPPAASTKGKKRGLERYVLPPSDGTLTDAALPSLSARAGGAVPATMANSASARGADGASHGVAADAQLPLPPAAASALAAPGMPPQVRIEDSDEDDIFAGVGAYTLDHALASHPEGAAPRGGVHEQVVASLSGARAASEATPVAMAPAMEQLLASGSAVRGAAAPEATLRRVGDTAPGVTEEGEVDDDVLNEYDVVGDVPGAAPHARRPGAMIVEDEDEDDASAIARARAETASLRDSLMSGSKGARAAAAPSVSDTMAGVKRARPDTGPASAAAVPVPARAGAASGSGAVAGGSMFGQALKRRQLELMGGDVAPVTAPSADGTVLSATGAAKRKKSTNIFDDYDRRSAKQGSWLAERDRERGGGGRGSAAAEEERERARKRSKMDLTLRQVERLVEERRSGGALHTDAAAGEDDDTGGGEL